MSDYKTINIDRELHKKLKFEAVRQGVSITTLLHKYISLNIGGWKPNAVPKTPKEKILTPNGSPTTLEATPSTEGKNKLDMPFE